MNRRHDYPGTRQHQALLRAIVSYYAGDPRILAISLFGSLGRGTWDQYSDLDLDIVIAEGVQIAIRQELTTLCHALAAMGEQVMLIVPDGDEAGDVVFESLMEFSVRYHPLATTSPNIVESLLVLAGTIAPAAIQAAGQANRQASDRQQPEHILDMCVRYAVGVDTALQRGRIWAAIDLLHRMRDLLMELFARTRGHTRTYQAFQAEADSTLQSRLGATLPRYELISTRKSFGKLLNIIENDLGNLSDGRVQLSEYHRKVLDQIRARQAQLAGLP